MTALARLFAFYRLHPGLFALTTVLIAVINACQPVVPYLQGLALHELETGRAVVRLAAGGWDTSRAWAWAGVIIGAAVVLRLAQYLVTVLSMVLGQRLLRSLRLRLFAAVQGLDPAYHRSHGAGELITRTTRDSDKVRDAVVGGYRTALEVGMTVLGNLAVLAWYHWSLGLVPLLLVVSAFVLLLQRTPGLVALNRAADEAYDGVTQDLGEGITGVRVIKSFALEGHAIARFRGRIATFVTVARQSAAFAFRHVTPSQLLISLGHVWVLLMGCWLIAHGRLNRGELVAAMMLVQNLVFRAESLGRLLQTFADARASAERVVEVLDAPRRLRDGDQALPPRPWGLRLAGVRVEIQGRPLLAGVDLTVDPGEVVALVGKTGSGKTTLATLAPRFADPDAGSVTVGGPATAVEVRTLALDPLRQAVQLVAQESFLFSDTLAGNLRMAAPAASDAQLVEALQLAAAEDVLAGLPQGLATRIGERGVTLSGGQRQRICIARALLAEPAVLILDDATSAVDAVTERRILQGLRQHPRLRTTAILLIASKLSTIRLASRVLLLDDGVVRAAGDHDTLTRTSAAYRRLLGLEEEAA